MKPKTVTTLGHLFGRSNKAALRQNIKDQDFKKKKFEKERIKLEKKERKKRERQRRAVRVSNTLKRAKESGYHAEQ